VISSLFSYNPAVTAPARARAPATAGLPSNAPIDSSSFSGLGLDPLLTDHLSTKLSISAPTSIQRASLPILLRPYDASFSSSPSTHRERDVFIQSQTGSGKTLAFLLPIIQDLLPLSSLSWIDRSIGTLAIIIAPTRELAKQISDVVEQLLQLRLRGRGTDDSAQDGVPDASERRTRWLVSGLLSGGATRTHEKARLRKGCPILVATPGRLLDHLQNTSSFNVSKCRWLVLDEADRLMELGFEETITGILKALDGRRKLAMQAVEDGVGTEVGGWDWERQRRSILCSATIREDVQKLAGVALNNPVVIKATEQEPTTANNTLTKSGTGSTNQPGSDLAMTTKFTPPTQLMQKYVVVPLKLRLVTLVSLLRALLSKTENKRGAKVIVFFSCTDSVDFHFRLLGSSSMSNDGSSAEKATDKKEEDSEEDSDEEEQEQQKQDKLEAAVRATSDLLPDVSIFRLHGSLALSQRLEAVKGFASTGSSGKQSLSATASSSSAPSILLCTSVASRGLDLPFVRAVVQYDLPTEGGATEYVHRVGRTARAGKGGEAWSFVGPSESEWVKWVEGRMMGEVPGVPAPVQGSEGTVQLRQEGLDDVLKGGLGGRGAEFEERATEVQLTFERWALKSKSASILSFSNTKLLLTIHGLFSAHRACTKSVFVAHPSVRHPPVG
jgi:ATP-dependent RNA helicase DDX31/DBP7